MTFLGSLVSAEEGRFVEDGSTHQRELLKSVSLWIRLFLEFFFFQNRYDHQIVSNISLKSNQEIENVKVLCSKLKALNSKLKERKQQVIFSSFFIFIFSSGTFGNWDLNKYKEEIVKKKLSYLERSRISNPILQII